MESPAINPAVVTGVSGSIASARALRWAADEASRRHGRLKVVLAWQTQPRALYAPVVTAQELASRRQQAVDALAATVRAVLGPELAANVTTEVIEGNPERALVDSSAGADLLVLGAASRRLAEGSIGPVVRTCLSRAHCPVVVVGPEDMSGGDPGDLADAAADVSDDRKPAVARVMAAL
jgi:nucleotide-binding universal stress UspA family protein